MNFFQKTFIITKYYIKGASNETNKLVTRGGGSRLNAPDKLLSACITKKICYNSDDVHHIINGVYMKKAFTLAEVFSPYPTSQRHNAFTLAEVLITLGIIGVVAAMTLPAVINDKQNKELHTEFKKLYSEINQVSQQLYAQEGITMPEYSRSVGSVKALEKFMSYFKGMKKVSDHTYNSTDADGNRTEMPYKLMPFKSAVSTGPVCDISGFRTELGGRIFLINDQPVDENQNGPVLCVDINGYKKPNRFGKDYFLFVFTTDGTVIPLGMEHRNNIASGGSYAPNFNREGSEYCRNTANAEQQFTCGYYALSDTHPQKEGKSYWKDFINER